MTPTHGRRLWPAARLGVWRSRLAPLAPLLLALLAFACSCASAGGAEQHHLSHSHSHHAGAADAHSHGRSSPNGAAPSAAGAAAAASAPPRGAFPLTIEEAGRQLAETRAYTLAVAERIDAIYNSHFSKAQNEAGMTQREFAAAVAALEGDLSRDPLYTAGVSDRPGAVKPRFDWPWTRSYKIADEYYMHIGWGRANTMQWWNMTERSKTFGATEWIDRRPQILGEWSDVPAGCAEGEPGFLWQHSVFVVGQNQPDGPIIRLCKGTPPEATTLPALPKTNHRVTVCLHTVSTPLASLHHRYRSESLSTWFEHYTALGAEHFYLYASRIPFIDVPGYSYEWMDVTWMHTFKLSQYGQFWAINDCFYRNREQGNQWTLFVDIDELLVLPGVTGGLPALASLLEADGYESAHVHSVPYLSSYCQPGPEEEGRGAEPSPAAAAPEGGGLGPSERFIFRSIYPENCEDMYQIKCLFDNILAKMSRRKVFAKSVASLGVDIHHLTFMDDEAYDALMLTRPGAKRGDFKIPIRAINGSRAWMKHVRSVGFDDVTEENPAKRLLCHGPPAGCEHVPGGLQCHDDVGEVGLLNPSNQWVDERPYQLMAMGMGNIFAGAYDAPSWGGALPYKKKRRRRRRSGMLR